MASCRQKVALDISPPNMETPRRTVYLSLRKAQGRTRLAPWEGSAATYNSRESGGCCRGGVAHGADLRTISGSSSGRGRVPDRARQAGRRNRLRPDRASLLRLRAAEG